MEPDGTKEGGYDEVWYCAVCGEELKREHFVTVARNYGQLDVNYDVIEENYGPIAVNHGKVKRQFYRMATELSPGDYALRYSGFKWVEDENGEYQGYLEAGTSGVFTVVPPEGYRVEKVLYAFDGEPQELTMEGDNQYRVTAPDMPDTPEGFAINTATMSVVLVPIESGTQAPEAETDDIEGNAFAPDDGAILPDMDATSPREGASLPDEGANVPDPGIVVSPEAAAKMNKEETLDVLFQAFMDHENITMPGPEVQIQLQFKPEEKKIAYEAERIQVGANGQAEQAQPEDEPEAEPVRIQLTDNTWVNFMQLVSFDKGTNRDKHAIRIDGMDMADADQSQIDALLARGDIMLAAVECLNNPDSADRLVFVLENGARVSFEEGAMCKLLKTTREKIIYKAQEDLKKNENEELAKLLKELQEAEAQGRYGYQESEASDIVITLVFQTDTGRTQFEEKMDDRNLPKPQKYDDPD